MLFAVIFTWMNKPGHRLRAPPLLCDVSPSELSPLRLTVFMLLRNSQLSLVSCSFPLKSPNCAFLARNFKTSRESFPCRKRASERSNYSSSEYERAIFKWELCLNISSLCLLLPFLQEGFWINSRSTEAQPARRLAPVQLHVPERWTAALLSALPGLL